MIFRVGIENNDEGFRTIAWALEHPGCFSYGKEAAEAVANFPTAVREYSMWIAGHEPSWIIRDQVEVRAEETWTVYSIDDSFDRAESGYDVSAWFQHDWKPLAGDEITRALKLLAWSRSDLLALVGGLSPEQWTIKKEGERWDVTGIVKHVGGAEWWYLDRLGLAFPRQDVPKGPLERIEKVRARLLEILPGLEGSRQVVGVDGEFWSPRKVLRRALWHERDHILHIRKLL
jgi:hypothetical protein